jgi:hypothetical protein
MSHASFKSLEDKVDTLIKLCDDIRRLKTLEQGQT